MNKENLINHVEKCLTEANKFKSKISEDILNIPGMSGKKTRHFYNNICSFKECKYLEIGTWKGSTISAAMYKNNCSFICIDNWSEWGNNLVKKHFRNNIKKYKGNNKFKFIEGDCFKINIENIKDINVLMYDGNHSYDSHYKVLNYYYNSLDNVFIFIVDDWNFKIIREATKKSIKDLNLKIIYEKEIIPRDNRPTRRVRARRNWWNGIYVCILEKSKLVI